MGKDKGKGHGGGESGEMEQTQYRTQAVKGEQGSKELRV